MEMQDKIRKFVEDLRNDIPDPHERGVFIKLLIECDLEDLQDQITNLEIRLETAKINRMAFDSGLKNGNNPNPIEQVFPHRDGQPVKM